MSSTMTIWEDGDAERFIEERPKMRRLLIDSFIKRRIAYEQACRKMRKVGRRLTEDEWRAGEIIALERMMKARRKS